MEKIKLTIELKKDIHDKLLKHINDTNKTIGNQSTTSIEEFIASLIDTYIASSEQISTIGDKVNKIIDILGPDINNFDISKMFNFSKEEPKKDKPKDNNADESKLKN